PNGAIFINAPTTVNLLADASDADGVQQVDFYANNSLVPGGSITTPPYTFNWQNVPAGNYTLVAVATDTTGATASSDPVSIIVGLPTLTLNPTSTCPR